MAKRYCIVTFLLFSISKAFATDVNEDMARKAAKLRLIENQRKSR